MPNNKSFETSTLLVKKAALFLKGEIKTKEITSVPLDIKKFIDEAATLETNQTKRYSLERSIKLRGVMLAFFATHKIVPSVEIKEMIDGFKSIKSIGDAAAYFSDAYDAIYRLLEKYPSREFDEAKIYFIDEEAAREISRISSTLEKLKTRAIDKTLLKFNRIINFLNPDNYATWYKVDYKKKYQYISKTESIEKYLPAHFEVMKNKINKHYRELFETHKFDNINKRLLEDKRDVELKKMQDEYNFLKKELENENEGIDIRILSYEHASIYPEISFSVTEIKNGKDKRITYHKHLRSEVVNALWYKPVQVKSNNTISDILLNYTHAFGDVYYQLVDTPPHK